MSIVHFAGANGDRGKRDAQVAAGQQLPGVHAPGKPKFDWKNWLLDNIVTANTKGVHVVELAFGDITTSKPEEIVNIKRSLKDNCEYEVLFYYDDVGFINKCVLTEYPAEK